MTSAVFLVDGCQDVLCARRIVLGAFSSVFCSASLGYGPCRDTGMRAGLKMAANAL